MSQQTRPEQRWLLLKGLKGSVQPLWARALLEEEQLCVSLMCGEGCCRSSGISDFPCLSPFFSMFCQERQKSASSAGDRVSFLKLAGLGKLNSGHGSRLSVKLSKQLCVSWCSVSPEGASCFPPLISMGNLVLFSGVKLVCGFC